MMDGICRTALAPISVAKGIVGQFGVGEHSGKVTADKFDVFIIHNIMAMSEQHRLANH
jgi:hypothetical protein